MPVELSSVRVGLQQRVLPAYRAPFFESLGAALPGGLSLFAGQPLPGESIAAAERLKGLSFVQAHNLHISDPSSPYYLCWQGGLLDWLNDWQPHVLIVEANPRYLNTRRAVRWMYRRGGKVLGWGLGAPPVGGRLKSLRLWERRSFLRSLDGIIAYSRRGAQEYKFELSAAGKPQLPVFTAANAVMPAPSQPPSERSPEPEGKPTVLFVGRLQQRKRLDLLLRACAALPESIQPRLLVVGEGPARAAFEAQAASLYPAAEFLGEKHGAELDPIYAAADLFALPGTGGLAVQQAMAYALPVLVAQGDGTQDDLVRPANGWQVPPDDLPAMSHALQAALSDVPRLRQMGLESYRIVREEVNLEAMVRSFTEAIRAVLAD